MRSGMSGGMVVALFVTGGMVSAGCGSHDETTSEITRGLSGSSLGMVVDQASQSATVFDANTNAILGTVPGLGGVGVANGDCSITGDGTRGFFTRFNSSVTAVNLTTTPPTLAGAPNPITVANPGEDTALSPDQKFLVVCDGSTTSPISVIDVATQTPISAFNTGADCNSVDVCSDNSVLITSFVTNRVRRLVLSATGTLTDTGESLASAGPNNVHCSPSATAGIVVQRNINSVVSFKIPGLTAVSTRALDTGGLSGAINRAGDRAFVRTFSGRLSAFSLDETTAALGAPPIFAVATAPAQTFFGIDQFAIHPSDASLYVTVPGAVRILSAATGATIGSITGAPLAQATGICFGADTNEAPVAVCADRTVAADGTCQAAASVDNGSFDPDGDAIECVQVPSGPFGEGTTSVTLTCSDPQGASSSCTATVTVVDQTPPVVTTSTPAPLWPPNHAYHRIDIADCITAIEDACQGPIDVASHARFTCCSSDEPDNGGGDGNTENDCVILDDRSVNVRAERAGGGNGRVYTLRFTVTDDANNTSEHTCAVSVPHSQNGAPAVDDGPATTCP
jgi:hypothetical protein